MTNPIPRRAFLARATLAVFALPDIARNTRERLQSFSVRVGAINMSREDPLGMGLILGAEEARRAASMFGGAVDVVSIAASDFEPNGLSAVIGDGDTDRCVALSARANAAGVPFLNIACSADALRGMSCRPRLFNVGPSDAMTRDALVSARAEGTVAAWSSSLERFGADTLNRRFQARFQREMTPDAWTAWMAMKIVWESSLRMRSGEAAKLLEYLSREETQFDGHKGAPLSFRHWDRQLRQPLYVTTVAGIVEVPAANGAGNSVRDLLDRLGTRAGDSTCPAVS